MKQIILATIILTLTIVLSSCSKDLSVDIEGIIVNISDASSNTIIHVQDDKDTADYIYDNAVVTVTHSTIIRINGKDKKYTQGDLSQNLRIKVEFTGPVRESYPVQADAKIIEIILE